jgi:hypothetical protein
MADNNVVKFRRIEKKPETPKRPSGSAPDERSPPDGRLSLVAWAGLVAAAVAIVLLQQSGLFG